MRRELLLNSIQKGKKIDEKNLSFKLYLVIYFYAVSDEQLCPRHTTMAAA